MEVLGYLLDIHSIDLAFIDMYWPGHWLQILTGPLLLCTYAIPRGASAGVIGVGGVMAACPLIARAVKLWCHNTTSHRDKSRLPPALGIVQLAKLLSQLRQERLEFW